MKVKLKDGWVFPEFFRAVVSTDPDVDLRTRFYGAIAGLGMMVIEPVIRICNKLDVH